MEMEQVKRIAIIGAGPSGIFLMRSFVNSLSNGTKIPEIVCFEKQKESGGQWNMNWRLGLDENGESVHSSMYKNLFSNAPKECLELPDYKFSDHFGKDIPSFPPREVILDYLRGYLNRAKIKSTGLTASSWIRYNTSVKKVDFDDKTNLFHLESYDYTKQQTVQETFDKVIVATGHFSYPNYPYFPGAESFTGSIIHSHDFKGCSMFKSKRILLVGGSFTAEDIASHFYKYGDYEVTISHRRDQPMGYKWPKTITEKPILTRINRSMVYFADGSSKPIDHIVLCTGYRHYFPFLSDSLKLHCMNDLYVDNLYYGVISKQNLGLFYIGMQNQFYSFPMFQAQSWLIRDLILGTKQMPSKQELEKDLAEWRNRQATAVKTPVDGIQLQGDYVSFVSSMTDHAKFEYRTDSVKEIFLSWIGDKMENIMTFRDKTHVNLYTRNHCPGVKKEWLENSDDSLDSFKKLYLD